MLAAAGFDRHSIPYAIDSVLRIVHTLLLSAEGGFLLHASSVVRNGRAFLFTGPSGAGKTTIVGLAPHDVTVLTDEISYVRSDRPTATSRSARRLLETGGEAGESMSAPVAALFRPGTGSGESSASALAGRRPSAR